MPGHSENISAATSLVVDVAGVSIIGLGRGRNRPQLHFTNTAGSIEMDAANTRLSNVVLLASVSAVVVAINVDADGVMLDNLEFGYVDTGDDFVTMIDIDAFDYAEVVNCRFLTEAAAGAEQAIRLDDCHFVRILDNWFSGNWSDSAVVGEGALGTDLFMARNFIYNGDTGDANGIDLNVAFAIHHVNPVLIEKDGSFLNGAYKGHEISKEVNDALDAHTKAFYSLDNVDSSLRNDWETYRQQFLTISKGIRIH